MAEASDSHALLADTIGLDGTLAANAAASPSTHNSNPDELVHAKDSITVETTINHSHSSNRDGETQWIPHDVDVDVDVDREIVLTSEPQNVNLSADDSAPLERRSTSSDGDLIEVGGTGFQLPLDPTGKGKLKNRYVLPDGTVVNGKGLGRGRPGIKRGPRKSALSREVTDQGAIQSTPSPTSQARKPVGKRKRADSDVIRVADDDDDDDDEDDYESDEDFSRDSTPEYNPSAATQTRSGRQSQRPAPIAVTTPASTASPTAKRPLLTPSKSSSSVKKHPKIRAKVYRGREQFALCEHCLRQHGPPGNVIVFCDACNKCWHQRCHEPKISKEVVADSKAEWFCSDCDRILHGKKRTKPSTSFTNASTPKTQAMSQASHAPAPTPPPIPKILPRYSLPLIPGMSLTLPQRKQYLSSLSKDRLVEIVLQAANLAPNMPIFETPLHLIPQHQPQGYPIFFEPPPPTIHSPTLIHISSNQSTPTPSSASASTSPFPTHAMPPPPPPSQLSAHLHKQFTTPSSTTDSRPTYTHPTAHITSKPNTQPPPLNATEDDEGYYDDFDEMALLYPKPGEGAYDLAIGPESEDLGIMLEGSDVKTFSHWVRGQGPIKTSIA